MAQLLLRAGAHVNAKSENCVMGKDFFEIPALHVAVYESRIRMVTALLESGAEGG